jgi:hypothetical protein
VFLYVAYMNAAPAQSRFFMKKIAFHRSSTLQDETMRGIRVRTRHNEASPGINRETRRYEDHGQEQYDLDANSAEEVISEIGLVLVVMLGIVVAINMALTALHIG